MNIKTTIEHTNEQLKSIHNNTNKIINKGLIEKYPYLMPRNVWTDKIPDNYHYEYIRGEYELPDGWRNLFMQMCEDIKQPLIDANYLNKFRFSQIKEKYGSARFYNFGAPQVVRDILGKYEHISSLICCKCGLPAKYETEDYILPYCKHCYEKIKQSKYPKKAHKIRRKLKYKIERYESGKKQVKIVNCKQEYKRLVKSASDTIN